MTDFFKLGVHSFNCLLNLICVNFLLGWTILGCSCSASQVEFTLLMQNRKKPIQVSIICIIFWGPSYYGSYKEANTRRGPESEGNVTEVKHISKNNISVLFLFKILACNQTFADFVIFSSFHVMDELIYVTVALWHLKFSVKYSFSWNSL